MIYYNENNKFNAAWLKALIDAGLLPFGVVDSRNIKEVGADDIKGFTQCHFFAGIGGWPKAFTLAGWAANRPVWSGSCPCQPFSSAGLRRGEKDPRHLWPEFYRLISESLPPVVFGEQVATGSGAQWVDGILFDLEALGYAVGAVGLSAASVNSPNNRPRFFWLADLHGNRCDKAGQGLPPEKYDGVIRDREDNQGNNPWAKFGVVFCDNGKLRRVEPGVLPLVDGFSGRMELLRAYGNAINPWVGARFVRAFMDLNGRY